jgi:hypothetical protein
LCSGPYFQHCSFLFQLLLQAIKIPMLSHQLSPQTRAIFELFHGICMILCCFNVCWKSDSNLHFKLNHSLQTGGNSWTQDLNSETLHFTRAFHAQHFLSEKPSCLESKI